MRILMTTDTVGGVWTYALELIGAMPAVEVTLATMGAPLSPDQAREAAALSNATVVESRFALEWMPDPWRDVDAAGEWLLGLARDARPDVVHLNNFAHAVLPFGAPTVVVAHSCACSWFRAVRGEEAPATWDEYRRRVAAGLRAADRVVAPTTAILRAIFGANGVERAGRVIANGRGGPWYSAAKEPFVLAAGRVWDEAKGLDALARARVDWPIVVAGPTAMPGGASIFLGGVQMLGVLPADELASYMARAAIYALPARYEPFGLSIVEAALSGCALVLGDIDTLHEVWGADAVYVETDPEAIGHTIHALAANPARRSQLAARARARAVSLSPARMAADYLRLYRELAGARAVA